MIKIKNIAWKTTCICLCVLLTACNNSSNINVSNSTNDEVINEDSQPDLDANNLKDEIITNPTSLDTENDKIEVEVPDFDRDINLSTALDMLIVYDVVYDENMSSPNEDFWEGFKSALVCNSIFNPFDEESYDYIWDNTNFSEAASLITGRELICNHFPEQIDRGSNAYSPYLFECSKENVEISVVDDNEFEISYDMVWASSSTIIIDEIRRVNTLIGIEEESPLDGYSILSLDYEKITDPVYMSFGETDYSVSISNEEAKIKLSELLDGVHTTKDGENISMLLDIDDTKEYAFVDLNDDGWDEMIYRMYGYWPNFFTYTDEGIIETCSPVGSSGEIWFTKDNLIVGYIDHETEKAYDVHRFNSRGGFDSVMSIRQDVDGGENRYYYTNADGKETELYETEYNYIANCLRNDKVEYTWESIH